MPTNKERQEVAARLRNYENLRESFRESPICAFIDALWVGYLDWEGVCNRLADLIEPEPERTCKNVAANADDFCCSECTAFARGAMIDDFDCWYPIGKVLVHCPNCGARVKR